jgi:hypothetical protein
MSWQGWVFMLSAWTFFTGLLVYCFYRILFENSGQDSGRERGDD